MRERRESQGVLRWGILGTGNIAKAFAAALPHGSGARLVAVASRLPMSGELPEFADATRYASYQALLADERVDAVYIATPHPTHVEWAIQAADAGKHILCEKPLAVDEAGAAAILNAGARNDVLLLEAFMYRMHEQTATLVDLIRDGAIGMVSLVQIEIGFGRLFDPLSRQYDPDLGGGAILDIGCYAMSMARLIAGAALCKPFASPVKVTGTVKHAPNGVDEHAYALIEFPAGITAILAAPLSLALAGGVRIHGTGGEIHVPSPWLCTGRMGGRCSIVVTPTGQPRREIVFETTDWLYAIEARTFADVLRIGHAAPPIADASDSLDNMRALDAWRASAGVRHQNKTVG